MAAARIVREKLLGCQVCVPKDWPNERIEQFVRSRISAASGAQVVTDSQSPELRGDPARVQCEDDPENVHVVVSF